MRSLNQVQQEDLSKFQEGSMDKPLDSDEISTPPILMPNTSDVRDSAQADTASNLDKNESSNLTEAAPIMNEIENKKQNNDIEDVLASTSSIVDLESKPSTSSQTDLLKNASTSSQTDLFKNASTSSQTDLLTKCIECKGLFQKSDIDMHKKIFHKKIVRGPRTKREASLISSDLTLRKIAKTRGSKRKFVLEESDDDEKKVKVKVDNDGVDIIQDLPTGRAKKDIFSKDQRGAGDFLHSWISKSPEKPKVKKQRKLTFKKWF